MRLKPSLVAVAAILSFTFVVTHAAVISPIADAAEKRDVAAVRALIAKGTDVNAAQGDGMSALHWAALNGDIDSVNALLLAKAKTNTTTRIGAYTPLHLASERGHAAIVARLLEAGSSATAVTSTGVQPIHLAAESGNAAAVQALLEHGADVNAKDTTHGRTPLIFAASENRVDAMKVLIAKGANVQESTKVVDYIEKSKNDTTERTARDKAMVAAGKSVDPVSAGFAIPTTTDTAAGRGAVVTTPGPRAGGGGRGTGGGAAAVDPNDPDPNAAGQGRGGRGPTDLQTIGKQGGFTALHYAMRDGNVAAAKLLMDSGADINRPTAGDKSTPMVVAVTNGQYDLAMDLIARGANPNLSNNDGVAPLFAALNDQWALRTWYPQPTAGAQQKTSYLELVEALLKAGADPNARTQSHIWYASYNTGRMGVDFAGATPFWRAAYALDVDAMRLLTKYGADPNIATMTFGVAKRANDPSGLEAAPLGAQHVPPFHAASGVGYGTSRVAQQHRHVPDGWMPAAKYFVEELKVDINQRDADGFTALHLAAARGDNDMIKYLVSKGANVMAVNRAGQTTVDMANSPEQRTQPFPDTIALLESMGAKNNHKCQACK